MAFTSGAVGALINTFAFWAVIGFGIASFMGVHIGLGSGAEIKANLYQQLVWGGIWGFLFVLPFMDNNWFCKGMIIGALPSLVTLLYLMPHSGAGMWGTNLGNMTFVVVFFLNFIWGVVASWWYKNV